MQRKNFPERKDKRREEATKRAEARSKRSNKQQLELIASRRGESKRERKKLEEK